MDTNISSINQNQTGLPDINAEKNPEKKTPKKPRQNQQDKMPWWFSVVLIIVLFLIIGGAYLGYMAISGQFKTPESKQAPAAIAPPTPAQTVEDGTNTYAGSPSESKPEYTVNFGSNVGLAIPTSLTQPVEKVEQSVIVNDPVTIEANIQASTSVPEDVFVPRAPLDGNLLAEKVDGHDSRLLIVETFISDISDVLNDMKNTQSDIKREIGKNAVTIRKLERKITQQTSGGVSAKAIRRFESLPFTPRSYRQYGNHFSVRVQVTGESPKMMHVGQAYKGWRLMSVDPVTRIATFTNTKTLKKHEAIL